jgi:hypothetical protein
MYVDPGSGSMLFQVLTAGLLGVAFKLRNRIRSLFKRRPLVR